MSHSPVRSSSRAVDFDHEAGRFHLLDSLAGQALAQVAARVRAGRADPDGSAVERLYAAAIGADLRACAKVAGALIADGLPAERICDVHIPATARRMGEDWVNDELPFSTVTIGTARLQGLLRELDLDLERGAGHAAGGGIGTVLLVVAPGADHTLGALVLASQLRRRGLSVRLSLGEAPEAMVGAMAGAHFDGVFLSATLAACLPPLAQAVAAIRAAMPVPPPLILGGALVAAGGGEAAWDAATATDDMTDSVASSGAFAGIDHVTCDLDEALRCCGLTTGANP